MVGWLLEEEDMRWLNRDGCVVRTESRFLDCQLFGFGENFCNLAPIELKISDYERSFFD